MLRQQLKAGERGAVLIHVAFALIALLAFTSFVVDYGIMWVSRRQAQNVADGAALAGAIAYMVDGQAYAVVDRSAQQFAATNPIWGQGNSSANVVVTLSGPPNLPQFDNIPPCGTNPGCVRVDVYRNVEDRYTAGLIRGNPLPTFFGQLVGVVDQGVRATATAETASGNLVRCLLPFAVADRWADETDPTPDTATYDYDDKHLIGDPIGGWSPNDLYEDAAGGGTDWYYPALAPLPDGATHTGWTVEGDYGRQLILKDGEVGQFSAGWANKVDLPGSTGADDYRADIKGCNDTEVGIAEFGETCAGYPNSGTTVEEAKAGCLGVSSGLTVGPTEQGIDGGGPGGLAVIEKDPNAVWNPSIDYLGQSGAVVKSASDPTLNMTSERIRPIAIFDIAHYMANPGCVNQAGTGCVVKVANIVGFFIEGMCDEVAAAGRLEPGQNCAPNPEGRNQVVGRIVTLPSSFAAGVGHVTEDAAFLKIVRLVR
jgi:putative Flp pilus-assembly TadE/G-like protein